MSERDRYPAGVPCWVETLQPDPHAAPRYRAKYAAYRQLAEHLDKLPVQP